MVAAGVGGWAGEVEEGKGEREVGDLKGGEMAG